MAFILKPNNVGEDVRINGWNWRPTLLLLLSEKLINEEQHEKMGNSSSATIDADLALRIADFLERRLQTMRPGERFRADLTVTNTPKKEVHFERPDPIDANDLYSAKYEWLVEFRDFCRRSGGFTVW